MPIPIKHLYPRDERPARDRAYSFLRENATEVAYSEAELRALLGLDVTHPVLQNLLRDESRVRTMRLHDGTFMFYYKEEA